jgi:hypothetical protein
MTVGNARRGVPCGSQAVLLPGFPAVPTRAGTAAGPYGDNFFTASGGGRIGICLSPTPQPLSPRWERVTEPHTRFAGERGCLEGSLTQGGARTARLPWAKLGGPYRAKSLCPCSIAASPVSSQRDVGHDHNAWERGAETFLGSRKM